MGTRHRFEWTWIAAALAGSLGFAWLAVALAQGSLTSFDETLRAGLHSYANPGLTLFMQIASFLGSQPVVLGVTALAAFLFFRMRGRYGGVLILIATGGAELLENILKVQFHRQRPEPFFDTILPGSYSFPSGHALLSLCLYGVLAWVIGSRLRVPARWSAQIAAAALILAIGISRIYLGVHHPTDVIGGYLVGMAWISILRIFRGRIGAATV